MNLKEVVKEEHEKMKKVRKANWMAEQTVEMAK